MQRNSCCSKQLCRHACCLSHIRLSKTVKETVTSVMLNQIMPKETSRNHTLLLSMWGINFFLLFPCILWDRRTQIFLERGLCMLASLPAPLAKQKSLTCWRLPYFVYGNSYIPGNLSQRGFEKGQKEKKRKREKKEEKRKKKEKKEKREPH